MIITSILDDDLYKFTMQQCVFHQYPNVKAEYNFICRNKNIKLGFLIEQLKVELEYLKHLKLTENEFRFLQKLGFFKSDYLSELNKFKYDPDNEVVVGVSEGDLYVHIHGSWFQTILYEVKILAIINELYFNHVSISNIQDHRHTGYCRLRTKCDFLNSNNQIKFAEFGTRRRYSKEWQKEVLRELLIHKTGLIGTSNLKLSMDFGIKPIGTQAHEYISAHIGLVNRIREAQKRAFHVWLQEYDDKLGTALSDTFTSQAFFKDFNVVLSNAFDGVRHDSGDPIIFGNNLIAHYKNMGINPTTKSLIFSDSLNVSKAEQLWKIFNRQIKVSFGIGTNLTNDVGPIPLNIVIKMVGCSGVPVVKLSDDITKAIGSPKIIQKLKEVYSL